MKFRANTNSRSGMVLLIVIVLLTAFSVTALTFLLTTGQVKDSAEQNRNVGLQTFTPEAVLNEAAMQVLRGTDDGNSDIFGHSLLEDMYGATAPVSVMLTAASELVNGMIRFTGGSQDYVGRVITCVDPASPRNGYSSVVVMHDGTNMYALPLTDGGSFEAGVSRRYIINQRPFEGIRDYDACDGNNLFLAARNPANGRIMRSSYDHDASGWVVDSDNDGHPDSNWLDLGMPPRAAPDGTMYKPMFAIVVEDLDGRLNVNAHGDTYSGSRICACPMSQSVGMGRGTAEIALTELPNWHTIVTDRLGASGAADTTTTSAHRGNWYESFAATLTGTNVQATPYDIRGMLQISAPSSAKGSPVYRYGNGEVTANSKFPQTSPSPYDLDLGQGRWSGDQTGSGATTERDRPYSPAELEAVLRPYDFDAPFLPDRLKGFLNLPTQNPDGKSPQYAVTTESWDLPTIPENHTFKSTLNSTNYLPEIVAHMPIDLMRAGTWTLDECRDGTFTRRKAFMTCLYNLLMDRNLNMGGSGSQSENNAQWVANVVDFLDADSIMTPFQIPGTSKYVIGCERPELLITETFAMHSRNTEPNVKMGSDDVGGRLDEGPANKDDTKVYENYDPETLARLKEDGSLTEDAYNAVKAKIDGMDPEIRPDGTIDFDQQIRPQGALYVELYNPWTKTQGFEAKCPELYNADGNLDLGKAQGNNPVWRLVVDKTPDDSDPDANGGATLNAERVVNLANVAGTGGLTGVGYVYRAGAGALQPGKFALVGPQDDTVLSFDTPVEGSQPSVTRKISMTERRVDGDAISADTVLVPVADLNRARLSLTEVKGRYANGEQLGGLVYASPKDTPLDVNSAQLADVGINLMKSGVHARYRTIHLQRLANPSRPWDANTNPYVTVDSMPIDLNVFNARCSKADGEDDTRTDTADVALFARMRGKEWKKSGDASVAMIWKQEPMNSTDYKAGVTVPAAVPGGAFTKGMHQSFGAWGRNGWPFATDATGSTLSAPVPWLCWLNRPPVSPMELLNVSNRKSSLLLRSVTYTGTAPSEIFANNGGLSGYQPNFNGEEKRIFAYFRTPALHMVTPMVMNPIATYNAQLPFAYTSMFREPGRVNLNTIYDPIVFAGLMNRDVANADQTALWNALVSSRGGELYAPTTPFRSIGEVPGSSILRQRAGSWFHGSSTVDGDNTLHNPYFRYIQYNRLANLATTRSNVYAVWITMGLFEVDTDGGGTVRELGSNLTGATRYRAFYLIDRSIPVGFERGRDYNADRAILLRRVLQ